METVVIAELISVLSSVAFWLTFLGLSALPYAMYGVAYIYESRRPGSGPDDIPVWEGQSRAFLPGDFGLALMVAVCLQYRGDVPAGWATSLWFTVGALSAGPVVFFMARWLLYTPREYTRSAWNSPTKRWHDFVMFLLFGSVAFYVCLPVFLATEWQVSVLVKLLGLFGLTVWIMGSVYDFTHTETPNRRQHPDEYQPIWRTSTCPSSSR